MQSDLQLYQACPLILHQSVLFRIKVIQLAELVDRQDNKSHHIAIQRCDRNLAALIGGP